MKTPEEIAREIADGMHGCAQETCEPLCNCEELQAKEITDALAAARAEGVREGIGIAIDKCEGWLQVLIRNAYGPSAVLETGILKQVSDGLRRALAPAPEGETK